MIVVRLEKPEDIPQIRAINEEAFGQPDEANIIDKLRSSCSDLLSLVAEDDGIVVGHILFSPVVIINRKSILKGMGLAPMAVLPSRQREGIGSKLVRSGLDILRTRGCPFVIVLGHAEYYPKFGFEPASKYNMVCQWEGVPDEVFMAMVFDNRKSDNLKGVAKYRDEFNEVM
jgi:putative acetyltransferase